MRKYTVPLILSVTIVIAGVFALIPVDQATAVHTQIQANTEKLDTSSATADVINEDFTITCPTASDGCYIIDVYLIDNDLDAGDDVDVDDITFSIDVAGTRTVLEVAADGANVGAGGAEVDNEVLGLTGPSGLGMKPDDFLTINIDSDSDSYTLDVIAMVEGQTSIEVTVG